MILGGRWYEGAKLDTLRKMADDAVEIRFKERGKTMNRFSYESNPPNYIYDSLTAAWYNPKAPNTVQDFVDIANDLSAECERLRKALLAIHEMLISLGLPNDEC